MGKNKQNQNEKIQNKQNQNGKIQNKRSASMISFLKLLILFSILIGIPVYVYFAYPQLIHHLKSLDDMNSLLKKYETTSIFIYIGLQVLQIIISVLPGQALQFAAGYAYTFWFGFLYSLIGVALGTLITFYLARFLGKDALHIIFGEERFSKFVKTLNKKKSFVVLFVIFLIPGIPKDVFTYAAGVSEIRLVPFLLLSLTGRMPAMIGSVMMGSMYQNGSYFGLIILGTVAVILFVTSILKRDRILKWTDQFYNKMIG